MVGMPAAFSGCFGYGRFRCAGRPDKDDAIRFALLHPAQNGAGDLSLVPELSVPVPANAFSISSQNTMTRGASSTDTTALRSD
jgi:hypothetical protein